MTTKPNPPAPTLNQTQTVVIPKKLPAGNPVIKNEPAKDQESKANEQH